MRAFARGGLTGEGGGDLTAQFNMRVVIARVVRGVTNLQEVVPVTDMQGTRRRRGPSAPGANMQGREVKG